MRIFFFDIETNGLPKNYNAPVDDANNWPRVYQFAGMVLDENKNILSECNTLVKPDGWEIPKEDFWLKNGNTTEKALELGIPIKDVIDKYIELRSSCDYSVAHNISFDSRILRAEMIRLGITTEFASQKICTMQSSTNHCKLPGARGYKWPKLEELYRVLFGKDFDGAHDAFADVKACSECFFEMVRLGVIKIELAKLQ